VALARSQQLLKALAAHLHTIREEERAVLARQIHDVLGQELTGIKMDAAWVLRRIEKPSQPAIKAAAERLERMLREIDATIDTVRRIATELRPGILDDLGLVAALEWQAREFEGRSGVRVEFTSPPEERAPDKDRATALFRIFQELLTNVARHARARAVAASLTFAEQAMVLSVRDDGRGISDQEIGGSTSLGLAGINERALAFGGEFVISGAPGKGTEARVLIPLGAGAEATTGEGR
jgi:signal transduction histidine kinase